MNMAAPPLVTAEAQSAAQLLTSHVLCSSDKSIGILLSPIFVYKRGTLYLAVHSLLKNLAQHQLMVDKDMCLTFEKKVVCDLLINEGRF